jgi:SAM-dependent methyltransferase
MNTPLLTLSDLPEFCEGKIRLHIPLEFRRGKLRGNERKSIQSAIANLKAIAALTERPDWSTLNVLDYGCGVKFTQALIQYEIDVQTYVGMDVFAEMIQCLNNRIDRPNFHFYHVPFKNEMYNPNGIQLTPDTELPGSIKAYDLFTLQSVFTHFNPTDFIALLQVLRRYAASDARMLFTCFIDNDMEHDFLDLIPGKPLLKAYYKEHYIRKMLEETSWKPLLLNPPGSQMQHHFVCKPY